MGEEDGDDADEVANSAAIYRCDDDVMERVHTPTTHLLSLFQLELEHSLTPQSLHYLTALSLTLSSRRLLLHSSVNGHFL